MSTPDPFADGGSWTVLTIRCHRLTTFPLRCGRHRVWKRRMRFREGGWYCPTHGLQAYAK